MEQLAGGMESSQVTELLNANGRGCVYANLSKAHKKQSGPVSPLMARSPIAQCLVLQIFSTMFSSRMI